MTRDQTIDCRNNVPLPENQAVNEESKHQPAVYTETYLLDLSKRKMPTKEMGMKKVIFFAVAFFAINAIYLGCANNNSHLYRYIITDEDHKPVNGVVVSGIPKPVFNDQSFSCTTASDGVCVWKLNHHVNETTATYTVSHPDYLSLGPMVDSMSGFNTIKDIPVTLIPYKTKVAYEFHVENGQGKPVVGSSIEAKLNRAVPLSAECIADQKGECVIGFELLGKQGVFSARIGAKGYYEKILKPEMCDKSETSKKINVVLDHSADYLREGLKASGSAQQGLAPHLYNENSPIEQYYNHMILKEVLQVQVTLRPLEKKVNEMEKNVNEIRDELATTKLSSIQANRNIESLQAEIQQRKSESSRKDKTSAELPIVKKNKKEILKMGTTKVAEESKKVGPDIQLTINDIQYFKVSDTQDTVLIYVNAVNNPKLQMLRGETPRIVLDFLNTRNIDKEKDEINTDGNFIKRIRIRWYKEPMQKVRVVFDMTPNKKYSVDQKFSKGENIYSFDIKADYSKRPK